MPKYAIGGIEGVWVNGLQIPVRGNVEINTGKPMREGLVGADGVHGYKETPQIPSISFETSDTGDPAFRNLELTQNATVTVRKRNGQMFVLYEAWFAGEAVRGTEEGTMPVRFEGLRMREFKQ